MTQILSTDWPPLVTQIFKALGAETTRAVGGYVRDRLMGRAAGDIDLATTHTPDLVMQLLDQSGIASKPTGLAHGTITAIGHGQGVEITTLRRDVATDGRRAVVAFSTNWAEDAARRDLTVNALYMDQTGVVYDPLGQGMDDLAARQLRFIGDAPQRLREDYLRILRLFRFLAQWGAEWQITPAALSAVACTKDGLPQLSVERVTAEWSKLVMGVAAAQAVSAAMACGLRDQYPLHPDAPARLAALGDKGDISVRLALVFGFIPDETVLRLPKSLARDMAILGALAQSHVSWQEAVFRHGKDMAARVVMARAALCHESIDCKLLKDIGDYQPPAPPFTATMLMQEGFEGPVLGAELTRRTENWMKDVFPQDGMDSPDKN